MNKPKDKIQLRREYVRDRVNNSKRAAQAIKDLAAELFLSTKTIERDLKEG